MNKRWTFVRVAWSVGMVIVSQVLVTSVATAQGMDTVGTPSGDMAIFKNASIAGMGAIGSVTFAPEFALVRTTGGVAGDVDSVAAVVSDYGAFFGFPPNQWQVWTATLSPPGAGWPPSGADQIPIPGMPGMFFPIPRLNCHCQLRLVGTMRPNVDQIGKIHIMDANQP